MKNFLGTLTLGATLLGAVSVQQAAASLTITSTPNAPSSGANFLNLGSAIGPGSFSGNGYIVTANTNSDQGFVQGGSGVHAVPLTGPDSKYGGTYVSTGLTTGNAATGGMGTVTFAFNAAQKDFSLLWGSVDASNELSFFSGSNLVGQISGTDVANMPMGSQDYLGSRYVSIESSGATFDHIVLSSGQISFEAAEFQAGAATPEPAFYGMIGSGLAIFGTVLHRRRRKSSPEVEEAK